MDNACARQHMSQHTFALHVHNRMLKPYSASVCTMFTRLPVSKINGYRSLTCVLMLMMTSIGLHMSNGLSLYVRAMCTAQVNSTPESMSHLHNFLNTSRTRSGKSISQTSTLKLNVAVVIVVVYYLEAFQNGAVQANECSGSNASPVLFSLSVLSIEHIAQPNTHTQS